MDTNHILTAIASFIGGGALLGIVTAWVTLRKGRAEARVKELEGDAEASRISTKEQREHQKIRQEEQKIRQGEIDWAVKKAREATEIAEKTAKDFSEKYFESLNRERLCQIALAILSTRSKEHDLRMGIVRGKEGQPDELEELMKQMKSLPDPELPPMTVTSMLADIEKGALDAAAKRARPDYRGQ